MAEPFRGPKPAAPKPAASVSPARAAAFELLDRLGASDAHSDDLLHGPRLAKLSQPDRDLTMTLVLGVLRWQIALDARVRPFLSRPDMELAQPVAIALRMGAFQLFHLERIPPHAVLNESVELVRVAGHAHAAGMVNAILRRLQAAPPPRKPLVEPVPAMAERLGHPAWIVERWAKAYGRTAAEAMCGFDQRQPSCAEIFHDNGTAMPVMDAGSRLVAEIAAQSRPDARRVWDCCAAPGGKTVVLAKRLPEAELLASDASPTRSKRLAERLAREAPGDQVRVVQADAALLPADAGLFDLVLCDVPCSGTGTLARNPEIRHRLRADDLRRQAERQVRLLKAAVGRLAPGGRLVYSTCSLESEENERVVQAVQQDAGADLRRLDIGEALKDLRASDRLHVEESELATWVRDGALRTLPGANFAGDGFFAALFARD